MNKLILGDCLEKLKELQDNSVDSIVTDPPAGISFMGKEWDNDKGGSKQWIEWLSSIMKECLRVLKPGGYALVWSLPKTSHWTAMALENAGFEFRDRLHYLCSNNDKLNTFYETLNEEQKTLFENIFDESQFLHCFGSGFPKGQEIGKLIDKHFKLERTEIIGKSNRHNSREFGKENGDEIYNGFEGGVPNIYAPVSEEAKKWNGWNTSLKPAVEIWLMVRKPLAEKTIVKNVLKHGTGAINVDGCRVEFVNEEDKKESCDKQTRKEIGGFNQEGKGTCYGNGKGVAFVEPQGRHPANLIHDGSEEVMGEFPFTKSGKGNGNAKTGLKSDNIPLRRGKLISRNDDGNASRFFYCAKASKKDRGENNKHPTCKSTELMIHLIKLITPTNGIVLDPFMGSGSTGKACMQEGFDFIGIEKEEEYYNMAKERIEKDIND